MLRTVVCLMLALQSATACLQAPENRAVLGLKTGAFLRMHVVAQDDTDEMQQLKLAVRDAVRQTYAQKSEPCAPAMLAAAWAMLPELQEAAEQAARAQGYTGEVAATIEMVEFDERELDGFTIPAGAYPALMIRLGEARGHNWWGLIDPELSLHAAATTGSGDAIEWDWSLAALLSALLGLPLTAQEGNDA